MDAYRLQQAEKWRQKQQNSDTQQVSDEPRTTETVQLSQVDGVPSNPPLEEASPISLLTVDANSLDSIKNYFIGGGTSRTGILFGAIDDDGYSIIVDAIYECPQDPITGMLLRDVRLPMVMKMNSLMCLHPVGILTTSNTKSARDYIRLIRLDRAIAYAVLTLSNMGPEYGVSAIVATKRCLDWVSEGRIHEDTTLSGPTVNGGVDGKLLYKEIPVVRRTVNTIVHTGFYRLNRPNHTPTLDDARAFLLARKEKVGISSLHLQLADYHLILFIADTLGESTAERVILSIHQEEDELVEDLIEVLMTSSVDI